jgi:uncharacterized protein (DUF2141 family)
MKYIIFTAMLILTAGLSTAGAQVQIPIKTKIETPVMKGQLIVSLCTKETLFKFNCAVNNIVAITTPITTATVIAPSPGIYAILVTHDLNSNGKLDTNFISMPTEPVGLSRNPPRPKFGPPKFEDVAFEVIAGNDIEFLIKLMPPD